MPVARTQQQGIAVIGAGVIGTSVAATLLREGHRVLLLDMRPPGEYCSWGNAGILSPGSCVPLCLPGTLRKVPRWLLDPLGPLTIRPAHLPALLPWLARFVAASRMSRVNPIADALRALLRDTFERWTPLARWAGVAHLIRRSGYLVVYESEANLRRAALAWSIRRERGVACVQVGAAELADLEPELGSHITCGMHLPDHGFVANPAALTKALAAQFVRDGGELQQQRVADIAVESGRVAAIVTESARIPVQALIVCCGVHSTHFSRKLADRIPLESERGYHVEFPADAIQLRQPVMSGEGTFFATPMETGLRIAGAVELAGIDRPPNFARADALATLARRMLPRLPLRGGKPWMGHRPSTPDSLPVIGPAGSVRNAYYAFGHGHLGLGTAAATASLVADMVAGRASPIDREPYRATRFHGRRDAARHHSSPVALVATAESRKEN